MSHLLANNNSKVKWLDVRDILRTDNNFRDANIDWPFTSQQFGSQLLPFFDNYDIVLTQGYIGATDENESTTLGREGSDYSAAIFAHLGNAESVTIWKDVDAVMSADPRKFPEAQIIPTLSFSEVIEMAYYGAQVIHPKTIKPLQNKYIPLLVKSFLDPALPGTVINGNPIKNLPPIIVNKENQVLIKFSTKDFSFIEDHASQQLHELYRHVKIKPNISQHTAISILCCFDSHPEKIDQLASMAADFFDVSVERNLSLLTIRHYNEETLRQHLGQQLILLEQRTLETIQAVIRG
jgi:aspartate kinase